MSTITIRSANIDELKLGPLTSQWSARGDRILRYCVGITHNGLHEHRELSAPELFMLQAKADALVAAWDAKFSQVQLRRLFQSGRDEADSETAKAEMRLHSLKHILAATLSKNDEVDWESLKDKTSYCRPARFPEAQPASSAIAAPVELDAKVGLLDVLLGRKSRLIAEAHESHQQSLDRWSAAEEDRAASHSRALEAWRRREAEFWKQHDVQQCAFIEQQTTRNSEVDKLRDAVAAHDPVAVLEHVTLVLDGSDYGGLFEKRFELQYRAEDRFLLVEYDLPSPTDLPQIQSVKFIKATGEMREKAISEREQKANFELAAYQICLRTIHEIFESDTEDNIDRVLFNGFANFVDKRTGQDGRACLLSVMVSRHLFCSIELARVDPKTCFKGLKGIAAANLASLTPIPPVMELDKDDRRFVDGEAIVEHLAVDANLASMPWEDFEHLIRELFEAEFRARKGEVKVTQASRDGGVDAVAFDPDPISGGKIVIQAKRYTRTVGVSAVRDLYGTVLNEGASKGILVTTADFGPDAYQFAQGKPLTLMSGGNLLHLLERHGHKMRINLEEARRAQMV